MSGEENRAAGDAAGEAGEAAGESVESEEVSAAAEPVTLSYAAYEELKTLAKERDDYLKRLQRAVADYQNLQKRIDRFRESAREAALRSLAEEVLPMADSLS
ncbi:MAG: nucleotide exchange factor GrpE, partial [Planctomycetota bacterium]